MIGRRIVEGVPEKLKKSALLLRLLAKERSEFIDRIAAILDVRSQWVHGKPPTYPSLTLEKGIEFLSRSLDRELKPILDDLEFQKFEERMCCAQKALPSDVPLGRFHIADTSLARIVYVLARAMRPDRIVETGVCYGVTSAYILQALFQNRSGHLHSIDLPPLGKEADSFVGCLVPEIGKHRWTLHRGSSRRLLPALLRELRNIEMFVHDSLHTLANMRHEFVTAWPFLRPGSVLVSDDVEGNSAFAELVESPGVWCSVVLEGDRKKSLVGVLVKS